MTKVEHLNLKIKTFENSTLWGMYAYIELPTCIEKKEVALQKRVVFKAYINKNGKLENGKIYDSHYYSDLINKYNIPIDKAMDSLDLMVMEVLYSFIMEHKTKEISWMQEKDFDNVPVDKKLQQIHYFLNNLHLKESNFYYWELRLLHKYTKTYPSEIAMLDFICNHRKEKSIKKALYNSYKNAIASKYYDPHSDYVFSRTISDVNLLVKLLNMDPEIKQKIFTDKYYLKGIKLITFLKKHYSEKQICRLFTEDMLDEEKFQYWKDTLLIIDGKNAFLSLERYFIKGKLTTKYLHDEAMRPFQEYSALKFKKGEIVTTVFQYKEQQIMAEGIYNDLEYRLPLSVDELNIWSKLLHNCMFVYANAIRKGSSLIYGIFKEEKLLYALEVKGKKIVQAYAVSNQAIPPYDMKKIKEWQEQYSDLLAQVPVRHKRRSFMAEAVEYYLGG